MKATTPYIAGYIKFKENDFDFQADDLRRMVFLINANKRIEKLIKKKKKKKRRVSSGPALLPQKEWRNG